MVFFNCSKKPPCSCFQPCSTTSCNANLPLSDDMGCLLSARQGRVVGRHPLSFYPHFQQEILQTVKAESRRSARCPGAQKLRRNPAPCAFHSPIWGKNATPGIPKPRNRPRPPIRETGRRRDGPVL